MHSYALVNKYKVSLVVVSSIGTSVETQDIIISQVPTATKPQDVLVSDTNNDGLYNFDLTTQNTSILNGQNPNSCIVSYFSNQTDYNNKVAIAMPTKYQNALVYQKQTIIVEVSNKATGVAKVPPVLILMFLIPQNQV